MQVKWNALLTLVMACISSAAHSDDLYYSDLMNPPRQIILERNRISGFGLVSPLERCPAESEFVCFSGAGLKLAVPKDLEAHQKWRHEGAVYSRKPAQKMEILGREMTVYFIQQQRKNRTLNFVYSSERGLLAFGNSDGKPRFFVLENACGFGAPSSC